MKTIARFLRRLASHIDPPPSSTLSSLVVEVSADTSKFEGAMVRICESLAKVEERANGVSNLFRLPIEAVGDVEVHNFTETKKTTRKPRSKK